MDISALTTTTIAELALSADNVMVWALIMQRLQVPERMHRKVLGAGIGIAVVVRVAAIMAGAVALERLAWLHYALGIVLLLTAWRVWRSHDDESGDSTLVRLVSRFRWPALAAVAALGLTDILFAVDSIPASFGITTDPNVIIVANGIALAALWFMYRWVSVLMDRMKYLTRGLVVVLAWVGTVTLSPVDVPELFNLAVIVAVLGTAVVMSLRSERLTIDAV